MFSVSPESVFINWTNNYNASITITANSTGPYNTTNITLEIVNTTTFLANYSQTPGATGCSADNFHLFVQNSTGYGNIIGPLNGTSTYNSSDVTLIPSTLNCRAGRYTIQNLMIRNDTNSTENLNITVTLDIPFSTSLPESLNSATGIGGFDGIMPPNATTYHSYYFNATSSSDAQIPNITSVAISMSGWAPDQDVDLFLFDDSGLKAKSINKGTSEWLVYNFLPSSAAMWEIRIYGNSTNSSGIPYTGSIVFSSLNVTNASDTGQQISLINFTSTFGSALNATNTSTVNLLLKNEGSINLTSVSETKELYYIQRFGGAGSKNFTVFVPSSSVFSKIRVSLNWTGGSDYSFDVYRTDGTKVMDSMNKHKYAKVANAMREEYNETTSLTSTSGNWRIEVKNNTIANDPYNVTVYMYTDASSWITSNFTNGTRINGIAFNNSTYTVQINLTVQNITMDGKYEGYVQYQDISGATVRIPVEVTTKTATLVVNNTLDSSQVTIDENIGAGLTKVLNITIDNTGSYPLWFTTVNSSGILNLSSANRNITFTYSTPPSPIEPGGSGMVNITIQINTTLTNNTEGLYTGYIIFITNDSHPYSNFTLNLAVKLNSSLILNFTGINPVSIAPTQSENVTISFGMTYVNGTAMDDPYNFTTNNFYVWLISSNYSSYRIPTNTSQNLTIYNGTTPNIYCTGGCSPGQPNSYNLNATIPANSVGGVYEVHVLANYPRIDGISFTGEGVSSRQGKYLTINNSGLYMAPAAGNDTSYMLYPGNSTRFYVNVTNYGPVASSKTLNSISYIESCSDYSVTSVAPGTINCLDSSVSGSTVNISVAGGSSCLVYWTITAGSSGSGTTCEGRIYGNGTWYNPDGWTMYVHVYNTTTTETTTPGEGKGGETETYVANLAFTKAENLILVRQNSTNSTTVVVKNTGNKTQNVTFSIETINSSWYTVNSTFAKNLAKNKEVAFVVTFSVGDVNISDYPGKFKANSSEKTITSDFILRVTPGPAKQAEINDTLISYKIEMLQLEQELNQSKAQGANVSVAESKLAELKAKITQAENYIKQGDYNSAYLLFNSIKTLVDDVKSELQAAKKIIEEQKKWDWLNYVFIAIGVVVAGILAYLFWPTKTGYKYKEKKEFFIKPAMEKGEEVWDRLKEKWSKLTRKK
jgi:hypothetical protein